MEATKRLRVTEACKQCRDRRVRCGGGHPCAVCVARKEDCVYEKRVDVQKKRGPPAGQAALLREENDALKRRIVELERVVAMSEGEGAGREATDLTASIPAEFAPITAMFFHARAPKQLPFPLLSPRDTEYGRTFLVQVAPSLQLFAGLQLKWLEALLDALRAPDASPPPAPASEGHPPENSCCDDSSGRGSDGEGSGDADSECGVVDAPPAVTPTALIPAADFMLLCGVLGMGAWVLKDLAVARAFFHRGGNAYQHVICEASNHGVIALGLFGTLQAHLMYRMGCLIYYQASETMATWMMSHGIPGLDPDIYTRIQLLRQMMNVKVLKRAPSVEDAEKLRAWSLSDSLHSSMQQLRMFTITFLVITDRKAQLSEEWKAFGLEVASKSDTLFAKLVAEGQVTPWQVLATHNTFRCILALKCFDFKAAVEWGHKACAVFESAAAQPCLDLILVYAGAALYDAMRRLGETASIGSLRALLERHSNTWPMCAYIVFKRFHGESLGPMMAVYNPAPASAPVGALPAASAPAPSPPTAACPASGSSSSGEDDATRVASVAQDSPSMSDYHSDTDDETSSFFDMDSDKVDLRSMFGFGVTDSVSNNLALLSRMIP